MSLLVVVAGPNGAGKTSASPLLQSLLDVYIDPDEIARSLVTTGTQVSDVANMRAGRRALGRLDAALAEGLSVGIETTLAGTYLQRRARMYKEREYTVHLVFLALESADLALARVTDRVARGGHDVPEETVRRRWRAGLRMLFDTWLDLADGWVVIDNSYREVIVARRPPFGEVEVLDKRRWQDLRTEAGLSPEDRS